MPDEKPLASLDDAALFQGAREPEPEKVPPPEPTPDPAPVDQAGAPPSPVPAGLPVGEGGEPVKPEDQIPSWRLREEAEQRRAAEKRAAELEVLLTNLTDAVQTEQRRAGDQQKAPADFYENPERAVATIVAQALQPYAEQTQRTMMALARMTASQAHTEKAVTEAEQAFLKSMNERTLDVMDYERVVQSPNRYDACVQWHRRQRTLAAVGEDPDAFFEKTLEARLTDPDFQAKLIEKVRSGVAAKGSTSVVKLPPSLSSVTSVARGSGEDVGDMSDASLFAFARK